MKRTLVATLAALLVTAALPAGAADIGPARPAYRAPAVAPPVALYNWTGLYVGAHVGWGWSSKSATEACVPGFCFFGPPLGATTDPDGFLGGGQLGFNWQGGPWVFGIEGDWSWTNADGCGAAIAGGGAVGITGCTQVNWYATATGRVGYAFDNLLLYAKGGAAFADEDHSVVDSGVGILAPGATLASASSTRTGWTVGGGAEYGFARNWSSKIEYNYMDFGSKTVNFATPVGPFAAGIDQQVHTVKIGINYRWGWGGDAY